MVRPNHLYNKSRLRHFYLFAVRFMSVDVWFHVSHPVANLVLGFVVQLLVFLSLFLATIVHRVRFSLLSMNLLIILQTVTNHPFSSHP